MFPPFSLLNIVFSRSHSEGRDVSHSPWLPNQPCLPHLLRLCVEHHFYSSLPSRSSVSTEPEVHLRRIVVPSARMEALMRPYLAAGFSDEVSRLTAAPRRPSTDRVYDASFDGCRARFLIDPTATRVASFFGFTFDTHGLSSTVKGYRTCIVFSTEPTWPRWFYTKLSLTFSL